MENKSPLISIIVPVYNTAAYLPACIRSITEQTYRNIEILLIDDGSTDRSGEICDEYAGNDHRITVIHKHNAGVSAARNDGLDASHGDYIGFVDSDDYIDRQMYEQMMDEIRKKDADICVCNMYAVNATDGGKKPVITSEPDHSIQYEIHRQVGGYLCNKLYRADIIGSRRIDPTIRVKEDILFNVKILEDRKIRYAYIDTPLYYYIQRNTSALHRLNADDATAMLDVNRQLIQAIDRFDHDLAYDKRVTCILYLQKCKRVFGRKPFQKFDETGRHYVHQILTEKNHVSFRRKIQIFACWYMSGLYNLLVRAVRGQEDFQNNDDILKRISDN